MRYVSVSRFVFAVDSTVLHLLVQTGFRSNLVLTLRLGLSLSLRLIFKIINTWSVGEIFNCNRWRCISFSICTYSLPVVATIPQRW